MASWPLYPVEFEITFEVTDRRFIALLVLR